MSFADLVQEAKALTLPTRSAATLDNLYYLYKKGQPFDMADYLSLDKQPNGDRVSFDKAAAGTPDTSWIDAVVHRARAVADAAGIAVK